MCISQNRVGDTMVNNKILSGIEQQRFISHSSYLSMRFNGEVKRAEDDTAATVLNTRQLSMTLGTHRTASPRPLMKILAMRYAVACERTPMCRDAATARACLTSSPSCLAPRPPRRWKLPTGKGSTLGVFLPQSLGTMPDTEQTDSTL